MKLSVQKCLLTGFVLFAFVTQNALAEKPKYAADIPSSLITPDSLQTDYLVELEFFDGMPNDLTVQNAYDFLDTGERVLADRIFFHYSTGITPAMAKPKEDTGSVYAMATDVAKGRYLDGGKTYSVTLPGPVPAQNFWSFMVYRGQTRSILETDQKTGGVGSNSPNLKANDDGSFTVWFGPKAPAGKEGNWVQTEPNTSYNCLLRLYSPWV